MRDKIASIFCINAFCFFLFVIDRVSKYLAFTFLQGKSFFILKNFLNGIGLHFQKNENIAFGIPIYSFVLYFITLIILIYLFYLLFQNYQDKEAETKIIFFLTLIITGALSNFFDRLYYGAVIDYISVFIWPVFNIADVMIVAGVLLWSYKFIKK